MSEMKLLPCPNPWCESNAGYVDERGLWFSAVCEYCGNRGPSRKTRELAIAAWNTRPAPALTPKQKAAKEMFEALMLTAKEWPHTAPGDCYSTGPRTGDLILDHVACPGCAVQNAIDAALAKAGRA